MKKKLVVPEGIKLMTYTTVLILAFMIIMPTFAIKSKISATVNAEENNNQQITDNTDTSVKEVFIKSQDTVKVYISEEDKIEEVNIEDYVCGVISNEMPASFESEALKAQAIAARTFLCSKKGKNCPKAKGGEVCDTTHCQVYTSKEKRMDKWENNAESNWNKIKESVDATKGMVLSYQGELLLYPQFFSTSSGKTENAIDTTWGDIPYLKSVDSPGEEIAPKFTSEKPVELDTFISQVNSKYPDANINASNVENSIEVTSRSEAGGVKEVKIGGATINGSDFRFLVGLNSTNFTYNFKDGNIIFNCKGYGHGVGMSQWGANVMAKGGKKYEEILKHYYTGVDISTLKFE